MNRKEQEKYELIRNIASRDWLSASSVSLTKLDQVKASVYNLGGTVTDTRSLKPRARSANVYRKKKAYTEIETEPPLSRLSYQKTAWGSNNSIPELIRQQGERLQRPESAKVSRRPWSGRKVPQSPSSQQRKQTSSEAAVPADQLRGIPIVVKGERYDPRSRPPSGAPQFSVPAGGVAVPHTHEDLDQISQEKIENTLQEFVNSQPNANAHNLAKLSAAYANEESVSPPPPPPCASPDIARMINGGGETSDENVTEDVKNGKVGRDELRINLNDGEDGNDDDDDNDNDDDDDDKGGSGEMEKSAKYTYKEINVKQSPRTLLLRRPTPEPVTFSIPTGKVKSEDEDELDTARLLNGGTMTDEIELESVGQDYGSEPGSPQHEPNKYTDITLSSRSTEGAISGRPVTRVTIAEDRNITVDITPRSPRSPRRRSKTARQRPKSAAAVNAFGAGDANASNVAKSYVRTSHPAVRRRPFSAKGRLAASTVTVDYGDRDEETEVGQRDETQPVDEVSTREPEVAEKQKKGRKKKEIETMMAHISISDNEEEKTKDHEDDLAKTESEKTSLFGYQKSSSHSATRNYYEIAMKAKVGQSPGGNLDSDRQTQKFKTIKTIEFGELEPKETKTITAIGQPPDVSRHSVRSDHEDSEGETVQKSHTSIRRPQSAKKVTSRPPTRPSSRMEHRPDIPKPELEDRDGGAGDTGDSDNKSARPSPFRLSVRPFSAPHRRVHDGGRRPHSPRKVKHRPKSATTSSTSTKCNQAGQSTHAVVPPSKISYAEHKRNKEAVKALKDGTLYKGKPPPQVVPEAEAMVGKPYLGKGKEEKKKKPRVWVYETNEAMVMDEADEIEMQNLHDALQEKGVNVSVHTLKKGLMPPREKGYTECISQLPPSTANTLLSHPEQWLGEVFQKYKLAEKALEKANERMIEQEEMEAKMLAAAMQARARKKKKVGKKRKLKPKRTSSKPAKDTINVQ